MSAELETMMYNSKNGMPWHKEGESVEGLATSAEALQKSGLDWRVSKRPVHVQMGAVKLPVPDQYAIVRNTDHKVLGSVGDRYQPLQNKEAFEFFDGVVGEGEAIYETAGSLRGGQRVWLLAKLPDFIRIGNTEDFIKKYVLLFNSFDGKKPLTLKITPVRVVCNNTLNMALKGKGDEVKIRHTKTMHDKLAQAHEALNITNMIYDQLDDIFNGMSRVQMKQKDVDQYLENILGDSTRAQNMADEVLATMEEGAGVDDPTLRGTLYHTYNSVTEWVDHVKDYNKGTDRLDAIWFGSGERTKKKAFSEALSFME